MQLNENAPTVATTGRGAKESGQALDQYTTHPYLERKGLSLEALQDACRSTVEIRSDSITVEDDQGRKGQHSGQFLFRELVYISGESAGYERILPERIRKTPEDSENDKFTKAGSKVADTFTPIGFHPSELIKMDKRVIVCAGLADGYRLHEATGEPVACGVGENNIPSIATAIKSLNPQVAVAVDNDSAGHEAGAKSDCLWSRPSDEKDWSDLYQSQGLEAVKTQFTDNATRGPLEDDSVDDAPANPSRFRLVRAGELEFRPPKFLVRNYLEADSLGLVFGDPGCGKSFAAIDMACCIATGHEFHGHAVEQGPVIYIAGEGQNGLRRRLSAWEIRHQQSLNDAPLYISTSPAALCDGSSAVEVASAVNEVADEHGAPALVVVDTLARNFGPGDENSTQDMGQFVQAADMIRSRHECTVLLVHHTGHADKGRARGAMALKGALDAEYRMDKDETGVIRMEATKMKDAPEPEPLAFRLTTVELGIQDDQGQEITSAVMDDTEYQPPASNGKAGSGKWQTVAREQLENLYKEHRSTLELSDRDPSTARVEIKEWREKCQEAGMPRQRFYEIKKTAPESGLARIDGRFVYPI